MENGYLSTKLSTALEMATGGFANGCHVTAAPLQLRLFSTAFGYIMDILLRLVSAILISTHYLRGKRFLLSNIQAQKRRFNRLKL